MIRLVLINLIVGFTAIFISACAGPFLVYTTTEDFLKGLNQLHSWQMILQKSAHGHFNLFGYLQILFALSLRYSALSLNLKKIQTIGLTLSLCAMGPGLWIKSYSQPTSTVNIFNIILASLIACGLISLALHIYGLWIRYLSRLT